MNSFIYQMHLNFKRLVWRNLKFFFFNLLLPLAFYLLFTKVMTVEMPKEALIVWKEDYLISMIIYSMLLSAVISVSNTFHDDNKQHFTLFVELSPVSKIRYYVSTLLVFITMSSLSTLGLSVAGIIVNQVSFSFSAWLFLIILLPIIASPLMLIGIMISFSGSSNVINLLSNLIVFPMAIFSGLWFPLEILPKWIQKIGSYLLPYHLAELSKNICHSSLTLNKMNVLYIILWTSLLGILTWIINTFQNKKELHRL